MSEEKIKVVRASGQPVLLENLEKWRNDYRAAYDKILRKAGMDPENPKKILEREEAEKMQALLERYERTLYRKYPKEEFWQPITEEKEWLETVSKYGPIMLGRDSSTNRLVYVIYDLNLD